MYICACVGVCLCDMCVCIDASILLLPAAPGYSAYYSMYSMCFCVCVRVRVCAWVCVWIHDADNAGSMCECVYRTKYVCGVREGASVVVCVRARVCVTACDAVRL